MLKLSEYKERVVGICQELGGRLPYEIEDIEADDWQALASELAELASFVSGQASRLAAYASNVKRRGSQPPARRER